MCDSCKCKPSFKKITEGAVIQTFVWKNGEYVCEEQEFVAGNQCEYEDMDGNPIDSDRDDDTFDAYQPFDMKV